MTDADHLAVVKGLVDYGYYSRALQSRYPDTLAWIYKKTKFSDQPDRTLQTRIWYVLNGHTSYPICKVDGKEITKNVYRLNDPRMDYCCHKCSMNDEEVKTQRKATCLKTYGKEHPMQSEEVLAKTERTVQKKYGCKHVLESKEVRAKGKATFQRHKAEDPSFLSSIAAQIAETTFKNNGYRYFAQTKEGKKKLLASTQDPKHREKCAQSKTTNFFSNVLCNDSHVEPLFSLEEYLEHHLDRKHIYSWRCKDCGTVFYRQIENFMLEDGGKTYARCPMCHPFHNHASVAEKSVVKWLRETLDGKFQVVNSKDENTSVIRPYELDILVKDLQGNIRLAIEFNGSRWHSLELGKTLTCQLLKTEKCEKVGITLLHIFEDEWNSVATAKKIQKHILSILDGKKLACDSNQITLDRSKFPKTLAPEGFKLIEETEPDVVQRKGSFDDTLYSVPNCGHLKYERIS